MDQWWSWILTAVGLTGFILAGRKVWWSWYVNIACQGLWYAYAIVTEQWGFIVAATAYTFVFSQNAYKWTKEHFDENEGWDFNEYSYSLETPVEEINGRLVEPYSFTLNSWELMTMDQDELENYIEIEADLVYALLVH